VEQNCTHRYSQVLKLFQNAPSLWEEKKSKKKFTLLCMLGFKNFSYSCQITTESFGKQLPVNTILCPYLLTPWNRKLLEKLTGLLLVKKYPAFYGT
jgi:hypothetical protein